MRVSLLVHFIVLLSVSPVYAEIDIDVCIPKHSAGACVQE